MSLPVITKQQFSKKSKYFPGKGKLTLTPFSVGQESLFLQVKDSKDETEKLEALKQIISECIVEKIDVGELPLFVMEYIFCLMRQYSIGEILELTYICKNEVVVPATGTEGEEGFNPELKKECGGRIELAIDLREVEIKEEEGHIDKIPVSPELSLKFKYPTINSVLESDKEATENDVIVSCIESIFSKDEVWLASESTPEAMKGFYKNVSLLDKVKIAQNFFAKIPHLHYKKDITCAKCGTVHKIEFNSLNEIFQ